MGVSRSNRAVLLIAVLAMHVVFVAVLVEATRQHLHFLAPAPIVQALIYLPPVHSAAPAITPVPAHAPMNRAAPQVPTEATLPNLPAPQRPIEVTTPIDARIDWSAAAHAAARDLIASEARELQLDGQMGSGWWVAQEAKQQRRGAHAAFPWSPQGKWRGVEVNPDNYIVTFHLGRRCVVAVFVILPGFGCALGHLDPEPGHSDLFDPKYRSAPLELPASVSSNQADH